MSQCMCNDETFRAGVRACSHTPVATAQNLRLLPDGTLRKPMAVCAKHAAFFATQPKWEVKY